MRRYEIDNLRILMIFLLFPVHTLMIWNDFGSGFYIWETGSRVLSTLIVTVNPWFMPVLFALAGMSARYSRKTRTSKEFARERITKLLFPFVCGILLLVPIQTLYARKFFFAYEGGFFENLLYFFTHITDMSGYDGAFTPGHLWFILFLFLISMIFLGFSHFLPYDKVEGMIAKWKIGRIIGLFLFVWLMYYIGNFGGYSLGKSFALYLLGYYVLSNEQIAETLEKNSKLLIVLFLIAEAVLVTGYYKFAYYGDFLVHFTAWTAILALLVIGRKYLNHNSSFTRYFSRASFPIYIFHQSILVVLAYTILPAVNSRLLQIASIILLSFLLTILCYEAAERIPYVGRLFGVKARK